eukprot:gene3376-biopygen9990
MGVDIGALLDSPTHYTSKNARNSENCEEEPRVLQKSRELTIPVDFSQVHEKQASKRVATPLAGPTALRLDADAGEELPELGRGDRYGLRVVHGVEAHELVCGHDPRVEQDADRLF